MIHQSICAVGRLFVLAGAIWKGKSEYNEMTSLGLKKYFQTTVNLLHQKRFDECKTPSLSTSLGFWLAGKLSRLSLLFEHLHREYFTYSGLQSRNSSDRDRLDHWLGLHALLRHGFSTDRSIRRDDLPNAIQ